MNGRARCVPFRHRPPGPTFASRPVILIFLAGLVFFLIFLIADLGRSSGAQEQGKASPKKSETLVKQGKEPPQFAEMMRSDGFFMNRCSS